MPPRLLHAPLVFGIAAALFGCSGADDQDVLLDVGRASSESGDAASAETPCPQESEPNEERSDANLLAPARCGTVSRIDARDLLTFRLKRSSSVVSLKFRGKVRLRVFVTGAKPVELTASSAGALPFVAGEDYLVEVSALSEDARPIAWRVELIER